jgi:protein-tyrosine phosphatase
MGLAVAGCEAPAEDMDRGTANLTERSGKKGSTTSESAEHAQVNVDGLPNLRDLGGKTTADGLVKMGRVFRSEQLAALADKSGALTPAAEAWKKLGVEEIVDFRGSPEIAKGPDPELRPAKPIQLPIFDDAHAADDLGEQLMTKIGTLAAAKDASDEAAAQAAEADLDAWSETLDQRMIDSYEALGGEAMPTEQFGSFLNHVASGKVVSFHCVSGKDRTGFAAAILLLGLGVSWKDVVADYLQSNTRLEAGIAKNIASFGQIWKGAPTLRTILGVDAKYLTAAFSKVQEKYGDGSSPKAGEGVTRQAIAAYYEAVAGPGVQDKLKKLLIEK